MQAKRSRYCSSVLVLFLFLGLAHLSDCKKYAWAKQPKRRLSDPPASDIDATYPTTRLIVPRNDPDIRIIESACARFGPINSTDESPKRLRIQHGLERATELLPEARSRAKAILAALAAQWPISPHALARAHARIDQVDMIVLDPDIDEVAEVSSDFPHEIHIGPGYAVDLGSDESALLMLVHELTHVAGGDKDLLYFFKAVQQRVALQVGLLCTLDRAEELACDLIAEQAVRAYIGETPGVEPKAARLLRAFDYDCNAGLDFNEDEEHLGQGSQLKCLFSLDSELRALFTN